MSDFDARRFYEPITYRGRPAVMLFTWGSFARVEFRDGNLPARATVFKAECEPREPVSEIMAKCEQAIAEAFGMEAAE